MPLFATAPRHRHTGTFAWSRNAGEGERVNVRRRSVGPRHAGPWALNILAGRRHVPSDWHRACDATTLFGSRALEGEENVTWGSATVRAAVMLVASFVLFAYFPDRLLTYLAVRTTPTVRDLLVSLSWVLTLV